jgi:type I restriction enzyme S subunit
LNKTTDYNSYYEKFEDGTVKCIDDEIPFEIPASWEWCRIANIFFHSSGKQQSSSNKSGGTPQKYITTSNLYWGYFVLDNVKTMNFTEDEIKSCSATKGDLLVCEGGAGYGRSAIWDKNYDICLQNHVHRLRPCSSGLCEYVYYLMYLLKESNNLASVGTAMPGLSANRLKGILVPLPPFKEQKRIVERLQQIIPHVEKYSSVQNSLDVFNHSINESLRKSILQQAIQGKLVPQDPNDEPASVLLERIRAEKERLIEAKKIKRDKNESVIYKGDDNSYYEKFTDGSVKCIDDEIPFVIPNNWSWIRLSHVAEIARGGSPRPIKDYITENSNGINWIKIGDTEKGGKYINHTNEKIIPEGLSKSRLVHQGDFLLTNSMSFGRPYITNIEGCIHDGWLVISPFGKSYIQDFLYSLLSSSFAYNQFAGKVTGAVVKNLNSDKVSNAIFPLPPIKEQMRIVLQLNYLAEHMK